MPDKKLASEEEYWTVVENSPGKSNKGNGIVQTIVSIVSVALLLGVLLSTNQTSHDQTMEYTEAANSQAHAAIDERVGRLEMLVKDHIYDDAEKYSEARIKIGALETGLGNNRVELDNIEEQMRVDNVREEGEIATNAAQNERLRRLEKDLDRILSLRGE